MQVFVSSERFLERVQEVLFNYIKGKTIRNWVSKDTITTPKVKGGLVFRCVSISRPGFVSHSLTH